MLKGHEDIITDSIFIPTICAPLKNQRTVEIAQQFSQFNDVYLADYTNVDNPGSNQKQVDLLIGIDYYFSFLTGNLRKGNPGEPCGVETSLGWIVW